MGKDNLGKLKHSTNKRCPECGNILQIRSREIPSFIDGIPINLCEEYLFCPKCFYEIEIEQKKRRIRKDDIYKKNKKFLN